VQGEYKIPTYVEDLVLVEFDEIEKALYADERKEGKKGSNYVTKANDGDFSGPISLVRLVATEIHAGRETRAAACEEKSMSLTSTFRPNPNTSNRTTF
jgi:hypothetical protein